MKIKFTQIIVIILIVLQQQLSAAVLSSVSSGDWSSPLTWNTISSPACGDSIIIQANHTISVTTQQNYNSCGAALKICIYGKLKFLLGSKLYLPCGSYVIVYPGGRIEADQGLFNSNFIQICGNEEWNSNSPLNGLACLPPSNPVCNVILPVELSAFRADACSGNKVCLSWETESELKDSYYEVERSYNGTNFKVLAEVPGLAVDNSGSEKLFYGYIDDEPQAGANYYRLKRVDKNEAEQYSGIVYLQCMKEKNVSMLIYPNYNQGEFNIVASGVGTEKIRLILKNAVGAEVLNESYVIEGNGNKITVSPQSGLQPGIYFCSLQAGDKVCNTRMIVKE
jgi:hypothetical protein